MHSDKPLVSVITPVYNGASFLKECIESVIAQSYQNFEYIIVNNCSTDATAEIAGSYAQRDSRIKLVNNANFLTAIENSNKAVSLIDGRSKYCKILHADDWMYQACLEQMVCLAEQNPTVGVVGAYVLAGNKVRCDGLPYTDKVISGKWICRNRLRGGPYLFGSPSSTLIRADVVRSRTPFYPEDSLHVDVAVMFEILRHWDFGFVHQVLTYTRLHKESRTATIAQKLNTNALEGLGMLTKYGPQFLSAEELEKATKERLNGYYEALLQRPAQLLSSDFLAYQRTELERIGQRFETKALLGAALRRLVSYVLRPFRKLHFGSRTRWLARSS